MVSRASDRFTRVSDLRARLPPSVCSTRFRLVRQDVSRDLASLLMDDFRDTLSHLERHPVSVSMTKEESAGFNHL